MSEGQREAQVIAWRPASAREDHTAQVGMAIFLGSWGMLFAGFFMAYALVRSRSPVWPPVGAPPVPLTPGLIELGLLAFASFRVETSRRALARNDRPSAFHGALFASLLAAVVLALRAGFWLQLAESGLTLALGPYAAITWGLTGFHAAHVLGGGIALGWVALQIHRGRLNAARMLPLKLLGACWHFTTLLWLAIWATVFAL